ncbi:MAG: tRNA preQ1(34) S-adenosylmethionine ribosyltransferase-isomerase QueA [Nitrospirae bacterium]|nr:tRNA preQ1(34) S-adenosylmethionine ribosyltransferase-isomerase QueA [Nitrospirota bacterium]
MNADLKSAPDLPPFAREGYDETMSWIDEFDYHLPRERIAQIPAEKRDQSRLLVLDPSAGSIDHDTFERLDRYFSNGDLMVINDSKVAPLRLRGRKPSGGAVELLLIRPEISDRRWYALAKPLGRLPLGSPIVLDGGGSAVIRARGRRQILIEFEIDGLTVGEYLSRHGEMPVPPYIRRKAGDPRLAVDRDRYQTVYAKEEGSVAAPTAGLHLTPELLDRLRAVGVTLARVTLSVGPATFMSLDDLEEDSATLPPENYSISPETADLLCRARRDRRRVVAVGTTVTRTLEDCFGREGEIRSGRFAASLFVRPGHRFRIVDGLITNFHQPRTGVLALACAFAGTEFLRKAYAEAIRLKYRFLSYGDSTFILRAAGRTG